MRTDTEYFSRCSSNNIIISQYILSDVYSLIHSFFKSRQFVLVDPPILHEQIKRKRHELYIPLFDNRYSLNSSNALFMAAYASIFKRVYSISPSFRNEKNSINHLLEFHMLEVEIIDMSFDDMMGFIESLLMYIFKGLLNNPVVCENKKLYKRISTIMSYFPISRIPYYDFLDELKNKCDLQLNDSIDLSSIDYVISKHFQRPIFIVDYSRKMASWTAKAKDFKTSYAFNLILPRTFGELSEGCERSNDVNQMKYKFKCAEITNLGWFIKALSEINDNRCGFGIGIERLLRWIMGAKKIDDVVLFPRIKNTELE